VSSEGLARGAGELSCADSILPSLRPLKLRLLHLRSGWRRRCPLFSVWPAHYGFEWLATRPITEPSRIVLGRKDRWHSIMDLGHQSFPSVVITANVLIHSPDAGSFQFSHRPAMPNGEPTFSEKTFGAQGQLRMGMGPNGCRA
jgi:hypothetical protein